MTKQSKCEFHWHPGSLYLWWRGINLDHHAECVPRWVGAGQPERWSGVDKGHVRIINLGKKWLLLRQCKQCAVSKTTEHARLLVTVRDLGKNATDFVPACCRWENIPVLLFETCSVHLCGREAKTNTCRFQCTMHVTNRYVGLFFEKQLTCTTNIQCGMTTAQEDGQL